MPTVTVPLDGPLDLVETLRILVRGQGDRTIRVGSDRAWWTTRTVAGPATVAIRIEDGACQAEAFGPGADIAIERAPGLVGHLSDAAPPTIGNHHRIVRELARRHRGVRLPRTGAVLDALVPAILEQKVTGAEARRAWLGLVKVHGEPAPGPMDLGLRITPAPAVLAALPYHAYHAFGVEQRRADLIRRVAARPPGSRRS